MTPSPPCGERLRRGHSVPQVRGSYWSARPYKYDRHEEWIPLCQRRLCRACVVMEQKGMDLGWLARRGARWKKPVQFGLRGFDAQGKTLHLVPRSQDHQREPSIAKAKSRVLGVWLNACGAGLYTPAHIIGRGAIHHRRQQRRLTARRKRAEREHDLQRGATDQEYPDIATTASFNA